MTNPDRLRKLADCVEVLRDVDGVRVVHQDVVEVADGTGEPQNPLAALFGQGQQPEMSERLLILLDPTDGEEAEHPDEPRDEEEFESAGHEIQIN